MQDDINFISMNCHGLANDKKREDILLYLKSKPYDVCCIQDTHFTPEIETEIRRKWGSECVFSHHTSSSRGVAILFKDTIPVKVKRCKIDDRGNFVILDLTLYDYDITLASLYGPNTDNPAFFADLQQIIIEFENPHVIICGDWNLVQDQTLDTHNYLHVNNPRARQRVNNMKNDLDLCDPWRIKYPMKRYYTWRQPNPFKQGRLDFFLVSSELLSLVHKSDILSGYRTDHSLVRLSLNLNQIKRGPGIWKFNNSLLKDECFVSKIIKTIKETIIFYANDDVEFDRNDNVVGDCELSINDQLFFETLMMILRGESISYGSFIKKQNVNREKELEKNIEELEQKLVILNDKTTLLKEINDKKSQLETLRQKANDGIIMRSKIKWMELGEKPSKYFLNLEKQNRVNKEIRRLSTENGHVINGQDCILKEIFKFYSNLYQAKEVEDVDLVTLLDHSDIPKLTPEKSIILEGPLSVDEVYSMLKTMKNNKSPGQDGFTVEFYRFFWQHLKTFIVTSLNYAYFKGKLSHSHKIGIITLIPKGNKPRHLLNNWRPISLLNVIYKIASGCIANRLKHVLPYLIHENQTGFLKGRFIGENIRLLYDVLLYTELNDIAGMLMVIDFEKAFDSVSHKFLFNVLDFFQFGPSLKKWIHLFYENAYSSVTVNGYCTERFVIGRGCRQGDPLSPYLFLLVSEILGILIRRSSSISGLHLNRKTIKLLQYADDTLLTLDGTKEDLQNALKILDEFEKMSNLKINISKTQVIWIGKNRACKKQFLSEHKLNWISEGYSRYLGIDFSVDLSKMVDHNYCEKIKDIKRQIISWSKRTLTVLGRVIVVKTLLIPKLNYLLLSLPEPNSQIMKDINRSFYAFIWGNKPDKISREQMCQLYNEGGVKMLDIFIHAKSLKISWIRRFLNNTQEENNTFHLLHSFLPQTCCFHLYMGSVYFRKLADLMPNPFWKDVLLAWSDLVELLTNDIACQPLWNNPLIKIDNKAIFFRTWNLKGIRFVNDILKADGSFLSYFEFQRRFDIQTNFLQYYSLCNAVRTGFKKGTNIPKAIDPIIPEALLLIVKTKTGCSHIYQTFLKYKVKKCKSLTKWKNYLDIEDDRWRSYCQIPFQSTLDTNMRWFQIKILNRILYMKDALYKFGFVTDKKCTFCNNSEETILHVFCLCHYSNVIWSKLESWILDNTGQKIILSNQNKLFGFCGLNNNALNCILIVVRREICFAKSQNKLPLFEKIISALKLYYEMEKYIYQTNLKEKKLLKKWFLLRKLFENVMT